MNPGDKPGIFRYDFDTAKVGPFFTQGQCAGCHALSNDGTKMLAPICTDERGCGRPMQLAIVDVATKAVITPPMPVGDSDTQTWSPDNKFYVTTPQCATISADGAGRLRDAGHRAHDAHLRGDEHGRGHGADERGDVPVVLQ